MEDVTTEVIMDTITIKLDIQLKLALESEDPPPDAVSLHRSRTRILEDIVNGHTHANILVSFDFLTRIPGSRYHLFSQFGLHLWCNQLQTQLNARGSRYPGIRGVRLAKTTFLNTTVTTLPLIHSPTAALANTRGDNHIQNMILIDEHFRPGSHDKLLDELKFDRFVPPAPSSTCGDLTPPRPPFFGYGVLVTGSPRLFFSAFTNKLGYGVLVTG